MNNIAVFHMPDLLYHIAHNYPGGIPALAARMDISPNVLNKKVDPNVDTHHPTLVNTLTIVDLADHENRFVNAMCANKGGVFVNAEHLEGVSDMALLETYTQLMARFGDFSQTFNKSLSDQRITKAEITGIRQAWYEMQAAGLTLIARLESLAEE